MEQISTKEFNRLSLGERAIILWNQAKFIETWQEGEGPKIGIYLLYDTLVSVYYNEATDSISNIIMWGSLVNKRDVLNNAYLEQSKPQV